MPVTVLELFQKVGLQPSAPHRWQTKLPVPDTGVYVVSLSPNPGRNEGLLSKCTISNEVFAAWQCLSPQLAVNGKNTLADVEAELQQYWKPKENILYIGESSSATNGLAKRVQQFYDHKVGWKGPHTGGYWIKLLAELENLYVYYAPCANPRDTEFKMLLYFIERSTGKSFYDLESLGRHLPFANLKVDFQKKHRISGAVSRKEKE